MIANNFNDFVEKVTEAERTALNTPEGQEITKKILEMKLAQDPNMTPDYQYPSRICQGGRTVRQHDQSGEGLVCRRGAEYRRHIRWLVLSERSGGAEAA